MMSRWGVQSEAQRDGNLRTNYRIWKWNSGKREDASFVRFTPDPTAEERTAPPYADLSSFENKLRLADPIAIEACSCADARLVTAAIQWLHALGVEKVAMSTIDGAEARCGVCK